VNRRGGCATWAQLREDLKPRAIKAALKSGAIVRLRRGRYALPTVQEHRQEAHRRSAVQSHLSAAIRHGWPVKTPPDRPWLSGHCRPGR
jgi:Transcriptional regulator, AbiEi antitoxin